MQGDRDEECRGGAEGQRFAHEGEADARESRDVRTGGGVAVAMLGMRVAVFVPVLVFFMSGKGDGEVLVRAWDRDGSRPVSHEREHGQERTKQQHGNPAPGSQ